MEKLIKCPLCGQGISSLAKTCPSCGHERGDEIRKDEEALLRRGMCPECGGARFKEEEEYLQGGTYKDLNPPRERTWVNCVYCGWQIISVERVNWPSGVVIKKHDLWKTQK